MHTEDSAASLIRSVKHFFSGTFLSRLSGMGRDVMMAFAFGSSLLIAAFMIAFRFSNLLRRIFGEGAMQSAFIPLFEEIRKEDSAKAYLFFKDLLYSLTLLLLFLVVVIEVLLFFSFIFF